MQATCSLVSPFLFLESIFDPFDLLDLGVGDDDLDMLVLFDVEVDGAGLDNFAQLDLGVGFDGFDAFVILDLGIGVTGLDAFALLDLGVRADGVFGAGKSVELSLEFHSSTEMGADFLLVAWRR